MAEKSVAEKKRLSNEELIAGFFKALGHCYCVKCHHEWFTRVVVPKRCPKCRSVEWYRGLAKGVKA